MIDEERDRSLERCSSSYPSCSEFICHGTMLKYAAAAKQGMFHMLKTKTSHKMAACYACMSKESPAMPRTCYMSCYNICCLFTKERRKVKMFYKKCAHV